jgi:hypothetical protein
MGAGVEPGEAAPQHLDEQLAAFEVGAIDVGDFEFAPSRRPDRGGNVEDVIVVEIKAGDGDIRFRRLRLSSIERARPPSSNSTTPYCCGALTT